MNRCFRIVVEFLNRIDDEDDVLLLLHVRVLQPTARQALFNLQQSSECAVFGPNSSFPKDALEKKTVADAAVAGAYSEACGIVACSDSCH